MEGSIASSVSARRIPPREVLVEFVDQRGLFPAVEVIVLNDIFELETPVVEIVGQRLDAVVIWRGLRSFPQFLIDFVFDLLDGVDRFGDVSDDHEAHGTQHVDEFVIGLRGEV